MVEAAVKGPGWGVGEDVLRLLPGPSFEVEQTTDDKGLPIEKPIKDRKLTGVFPLQNKMQGAHRFAEAY